LPDDTPVAAEAGAVLFDGALAGGSATARYASGARISASPAPTEVPTGHALLFTVDATGKITPVTDHDPTGGADARTAVTFGPAAVPAVDAP
jgi:hypothetical protein